LFASALGVVAVPPPEPAPGVLDEELLLGEVDELLPAEPEAELPAGGVVIVAEPDVELDEGEVELEGGVELGLVVLGPPASFPQPASANATAATSSEVLVIVSPLKKVDVGTGTSNACSRGPEF
jgi:hypothetical protein